MRRVGNGQPRSRDRQDRDELKQACPTRAGGERVSTAPKECPPQRVTCALGLEGSRAKPGT